MRHLLLGVATLAVSSSCCIARGARVRTPRGERPIEELAAGDEVTCVDPRTGALVTARLAATRMATRECIALGFDGGELIATSDHPLYCPTTGEWAPAGDWALGRRTHLLGVSAERVAPIAVGLTSTFAGVHDVFDLSVDHPLHDFVANGVLVHNKKYRPQCDTKTETVTLHAATTCGQDADLALAVASDCTLTVTGGSSSGLPSSGHATGPILEGFDLHESSRDGGFDRNCSARPSEDAGLDLVCSLACTGEAGCTNNSCSGTLTPK